jgi:hypothetical protein
MITRTCRKLVRSMNPNGATRGSGQATGRRGGRELVVPRDVLRRKPGLNGLLVKPEIGKGAGYRKRRARFAIAVARLFSTISLRMRPAPAGWKGVQGDRGLEMVFGERVVARLARADEVIE